MKKFRIVKIGDNEYHIQERGWFFWDTWICDVDFGCGDTPCKYKSSDEARLAISKYGQPIEIIEYV